MKKKMINVLAELIDLGEVSSLNSGDEKRDNSDNQAFYFLTVILIMIVTFSMFKWEILHWIL